MYSNTVKIFWTLIASLTSLSNHVPSCYNNSVQFETEHFKHLCPVLLPMYLTTQTYFGVSNLIFKIKSPINCIVTGHEAQVIGDSQT